MSAQKKTYWEPFQVPRKRVKTKTKHGCYFTGVTIFSGSEVESYTVNVTEDGKRTKTRVYLCGQCNECLHLQKVRSA